MEEATKKGFQRARMRRIINRIFKTRAKARMTDGWFREGDEGLYSMTEEEGGEPEKWICLSEALQRNVDSLRPG